MHNWKWVNLSKMAGFGCCFAGSLPFSLLTAKQTKLFHSISKMFFTFLARKTLWVKLFSLNVCEAALQAAIKGGNFGAKLTHLCGFWLDVSFFSHMKKHRSRFWLDVSFFFTCENHRSLLWLVRTNLRTKIYDIAFSWVFLSMYIISCFYVCRVCIHDHSFNDFENDTMKISYNEAKLTGLWARNCATIQQLDFKICLRAGIVNGWGQNMDQGSMDPHLEPGPWTTFMDRFHGPPVMDRVHGQFF